ncbi:MULTISPECIES: hypothetical protein [unclassified Pseudomonas]|jgi:hypothetical protein|uniref:hypothetical protein n=1 Tax=unclassified Pseudomonas TaxID=196821 RepID=UPI000BA3446B|nr:MULTISPECIES: hypothetical protein [unclassified Pseudomonas]MCU1722341.1 hypothetical protein [Pseudomonas sp. 5P_5.1_Bac1]MCU1730623.1 hypothetical protein [Pseudomonas sp. 20P_3.2_Bac4]MCU1745444.1 hypothetical protein [Pseudomonas sp. 20P_3.2_Bac5]
MQRVQRVILEIDSQLFRLLQGSAQANNLSLEEECLRRLSGGERRSRYLQALVAELRADEEQRRESSQLM